MEVSWIFLWPCDTKDHLKTEKTNSRLIIYEYNVDTCAYVPRKRSFFNSLAYGFFLIITAGVFFIGLLFAHDYLVESKNEKALETENVLLTRYTKLLSTELKEVENTLDQLSAKDKRLHKKFFTTEPETSLVKDDPHATILSASTSSFRKHLEALQQQCGNIAHDATGSNERFAKSLSLDESQLNTLTILPVMPPVENLDPSTILSGFGMRINPFHKALHHHPGIDIALPRGTNVVATASGTVKTVKRSELQAGYGNYIEIDHGNEVVTRYSHLESIAVKAGQKILRGAIIGSSGNSGGSVAPHLHYEIIRNGINVDPIHYFISNVSAEDYAAMHVVSRSENQSLD